jgi:hypothetical protein
LIILQGTAMPTEHTSPQASKRPRRSGNPDVRPESSRQVGAPGDRDPFLEVQAESGRRVRPVVAEHYNEIE